MRLRTCDTCRFAVREGEHLFCHRVPPTTVPGTTTFSLVLDDWWCAMHRFWLRAVWRKLRGIK